MLHLYGKEGQVRKLVLSCAVALNLQADNCFFQFLLIFFQLSFQNFDDVRSLMHATDLSVLQKGVLKCIIMSKMHDGKYKYI